MQQGSVLGRLRRGHRIWAIGAVRGEFSKLSQLHDDLSKAILPNDRLIYLGNLIGAGSPENNAVDEALNFRSWIIGRKWGFASDVIFLRGAQEEMLQKLFELQFALDPRAVLDWMIERDIAGLLGIYGMSSEDLRSAVRQNSAAITRWTSELRHRFNNSGHQPWLSSLQHAAYSWERKILFVSRGIDPSKPVEDQSDTFWWGTGSRFEEIEHGIGEICRVIRGEDPKCMGLIERGSTISIDGGCGKGGHLLAICLGKDGTLLETIKK